MNTGCVVQAMIEYLQGDLHETEHFLKVHGYAKAIGELEGLDERSRLILEVAAVVHDIGIPPAEKKYGSSAGPYQEELGPGEARILLEKLGFDDDLIARVCTLVGRHHTYTNVDGPDCRILLEADYLVNASHGKHGRDAIAAAKESFFRTGTGIKLLKTIYGV